MYCSSLTANQSADINIFCNYKKAAVPGMLYNDSFPLIEAVVNLAFTWIINNQSLHENIFSSNISNDLQLSLNAFRCDIFNRLEMKGLLWLNMPMRIKINTFGNDWCIKYRIKLKLLFFLHFNILYSLQLSNTLDLEEQHLKFSPTKISYASLTCYSKCKQVYWLLDDFKQVTT